MSLELTDDLRRALAGQPNKPLRLVDPQTQEGYVLRRAEVYERLRTQQDERLDIREAYPLMDAIAAQEGWNDPAMSIYDDLAQEPKRR